MPLTNTLALLTRAMILASAFGRREHEETDDTEEEQEEESQELSDEELEREMLMQLLDSLESDDVNLPLQQALDAAPPQRVLEEW